MSGELPVDGDTSLLEPFDHTVSVKIEGRTLDLPANNTLLRILQFLGVDLYPCRLCWNSECDNCRFDFVDEATGETTNARGCETILCEGMCITKIPTFAPAEVAVNALQIFLGLSALIRFSRRCLRWRTPLRIRLAR